MAIESTLDLCWKDEYTLDGGERKPWYVSREGSVLEIAPRLLQEEYTIASIALIMHQRRHSSRNPWRDRHFGGSDLFAYHRDGRVKYVPDGLAAIDLFALLPVENGAFIGDDALYNALPGEEFHRASLILNRVLTREGRANHAIWRAAFRDVAALHDYGSKFHVGESAMGVFLAAKPEQTSIRVAGVDWLGLGSHLFGNNPLDLNVWRLVGVLPAALEALTRQYLYLASRGAEVRSALERYFAQHSGGGSASTTPLLTNAANTVTETPAPLAPQGISDPYEWVKNIQLYTDAEFAERAREIADAAEKQKMQLIRAFEINREMKEKP